MAYPAIMIYACASGFSWSEILDANTYPVADYWPAGEFACAMIGDCMFDDTARRPLDFAAAWKDS